MKPAISVRNLSKCYKLGTIGRHTLVDEVSYWWHKVNGRDPHKHLGKLGHTSTEERRVEAEQAGSERFWALKNVSFDVQLGDVIGIIGRNGAGKSTLLKILSRITEPTSGEAVINGRVGSLLEVGTGFHPELTGRENVFMNGAILGMKKNEVMEKFDEIVAFSELEKFIDTPVKRYSNGMMVRLAFSVAAYFEPEILLVDEVLAVGDIEFQKKCIGKIHDVSKCGRTVIFVSHNMPVVSRICNTAVLLENGCVTFCGFPDEVIANYMHKTLDGLSIRRWSKNNAPGNKDFKLLAVSILDEYGEICRSIDIEKKFIVRIEYDIEKEGMEFRCMARFFTQGVCAFPAVERNVHVHSEKGFYVSLITIPGNLLTEGEYIIGVSFFGARGRKYMVCNVEDAISFLVVDHLHGGSARGNFAAGLEGVMRPMTYWEKEYLQDHESVSVITPDDR